MTLKELIDRLGIGCMEEVVSHRQLRWYRHIECEGKMTGYFQAGNYRLRGQRER